MTSEAIDKFRVAIILQYYKTINRQNYSELRAEPAN